MRIAYGYAIFDEQYDKNMEETKEPCGCEDVREKESDQGGREKMKNAGIPRIFLL